MGDACDDEVEIRQLELFYATCRVGIVAVAATACVLIVMIGVHELASLPAPPGPEDATYVRIMEAIRDHRDHSWGTPESRAIEAKLYGRLVEIDRARAEVEREVAAAARRIGTEAGKTEEASRWRGAHGRTEDRGAGS